MNKIVKLFLQYSPFALVAFVVLFDLVIPNSYWFVVARVHVTDSVVGISPTMIVARSVLRPFRGHWIATVKRAQNETETALYYKECSAVSESDYRPETVLPPNLDLNWWTFPIKCDLQPGAYIVDTSWTFHVMFFERTVRAVSNVFLIKAPRLITPESPTSNLSIQP